jgi:hypothetical protein
MSEQTKIDRRNTMTYVVVRIFDARTVKKSVNEVSDIALRELCPKLTAAGGLMRFLTISFSDNRYGSFSAYEDQAAARRGHQIATEWVKNHPDAQGVKLEETMEGEVAYSAEGSVKMAGGLHGVIRLYKSDASLSDLKNAFESEGPAAMRTFFGLSRYTVVKLTDGRVGTFGSFDTQQNARKSSEEAKKVRATSGSQIGRLLTSEPQVIEATVVGAYTAQH